MMTRILTIAAVLAAAAVTDLHAQTARVREMHVQPLASPEPVAMEPSRPIESDDAVQPSSSGPEPGSLLVYPVAGIIGSDVAVPYYVDLQPGAGKLDWNCDDDTFDGHTGHDPYIRSFAEQRIGVPVFAARDGVVIDVRDGEPDENTTNDPSFRANYVTLRHSSSDTTQYVHLRKGIPVAVGDTVSAGTQIGFVGSSGSSTAPHIHFEVRHANQPYEPFAGPCRPGAPFFMRQPPAINQPTVLGAAFSAQRFGDFPAAPHDDAPRTGTFLRGMRTIYFKADMANVGASTRYTLLLEPPGVARTEVAASGTLISYDASLASIWWGLDVDLHTPGTWNLVLDVNGRRMFAMPFTVVNTQAEIVNRPPNSVTAAIEPIGLLPQQVAVCRAAGTQFADPDYDVVRYRYEWIVNGTTVRDVTTAARSDALPRQFTMLHANITCNVTPSDGTLSAETSTAHATVSRAKRRRAVAH